MIENNIFKNYTVKTFKRNEVILSQDNNINGFGKILSGSAYLSIINLDDGKRIIDYYEKNDFFSTKFLSSFKLNSYFIIAQTKCKICFFNSDDLNSQQLQNFQTTIISSLYKRSLIHMDILSQQSLRNKIMAFFQYQKIKNNSNIFILPFSFSDMADYLSVERSSMMREISHMKKENLIDTQGRKIFLYVKK